MADDRDHKYSYSEKGGYGARAAGEGVAAGELGGGRGVHQQRVGDESGTGAGESGEVPSCYGRGQSSLRQGRGAACPREVGFNECVGRWGGLWAIVNYRWSGGTVRGWKVNVRGQKRKSVRRGARRDVKAVQNVNEE